MSQFLYIIPLEGAPNVVEGDFSFSRLSSPKVSCAINSAFGYVDNEWCKIDVGGSSFESYFDSNFQNELSVDAKGRSFLEVIETISESSQTMALVYGMVDDEFIVLDTFEEFNKAIHDGLKQDPVELHFGVRI